MLQGKIGIVTGASRGMGRHFVAGLVEAGAKIACFARPSPELDALGEEFGDAVATFDCDVVSPDAVDEAVAQAVARFGRIDFLVNNAAIFHPFKLEKASNAQVEQHVAINLLGPIWCIRACIPHLRASRGQIVSISSESVRMPYPFLSVYAATKGGLEVLSTALREELREDGIKVTTLRSGSVSGGSGGREWDPVTAADFFATIQRTGHAAFAGNPALPESMTKALVATLSLPADVNVDFLEVRAAAPATEESYRS